MQIDGTKRDLENAKYKLIGSDGKVYSFLYETASDAADAANRLWPHEQQDPDRTGAGWDVECIR